MKDYIAQRFAQAKAINREAGYPKVRYSPEFDAFVSWNWEPGCLDEQIDEVQGILTTENPDHPDYMLLNGLANGDLTKWDDNH